MAYGTRIQIPSFFETLESPAVAEYKHQQEIALMKAVTGGTGGTEPAAPTPERPTLGVDPSMYFPGIDTEHATDSEDDDDDIDEEETQNTASGPHGSRSRGSVLYGAPVGAKASKKKKKAMMKGLAFAKSMKKVIMS